MPAVTDPDPPLGISTVVDRVRVAELIVTHRGGRRRGSGYLVADGVVLTAAHVVADAVEVVVRLAPGLSAERQFEGASWWADPASDFAVVSLAGAASEVAPVGFGRLQDRAAMLTVQAVGFPRWKLRNLDGTVPHPDDGQDRFRDAYHMVGTVPVLSNWREGTLETVVTAPPAPVASGSPWEGMSGAPLWAGGRIIGVIARHHPGDGLPRLAAVRLDRALAQLAPDRLAELRLLLPGLPAHADLLPDVIPASIGELTLGGYRAQLSEIAPSELHGRDRELDDLVRFCAGDRSVAWWQAPAWAGKTALLSWFALNPPAGTDVVAFFITRRFAGQTDSDAFTNALVEQLAALCDEPVQQVLVSHNRSGQLLRLLETAANREVAGGRRLLLVVDGLDEDTSRSGEPARPSIASQLPKRPLEGLRILLASRPHPDLPDDVPSDHQLHRVATRELMTSAFAGDIKREALTEMDRLLRRPGLGQDVAGLITASGGGLTLSDLEHLTRRAPFELLPLLGGLFGRTVQGRARPAEMDGQSERVYLFAHETLRVLAEERFGSALAGFRERIHGWAEEYRARGWPPNTPTYLLRGYSQLLATADDLRRVCDIAVDQVRHDRQFDRTGGDGLATAEVLTATTRMLHCEPPDLASLLRLALARDNLSVRNSNIPAGLPAVWAQLGQPDRAAALAAGITGSRRGLAMWVAVAALAGKGDFARAEQLARDITDQFARSRALVYLVEALVEAGEHDRAERLAADIPAPSFRVRAVVNLASAVVGAGDHDRARVLVESAIGATDQISDLWHRARDLVSVVDVLLEVGDGDRARTVVERAISTAQDISDADERVYAVADLVAAAARTVGHDQAEGLVERAIATAGGITDAVHRATVLAILSSPVARLGDHGRASEVVDLAIAAVDEITEASSAGFALVSITNALVSAGEHDRAAALLEGAISSIGADSAPPRALGQLVAGLARAGELDRAEDLAREIDEPSHRSEVSIELANGLARLGESERARRVAAHVSTPTDNAVRDEYIVKLLADVADYDRAERIARSITDTHYRAGALTDLAAALAGAGQRDHARALAELATSTARETTGDTESEGVRALVAVLLEDGDVGRAERVAHAILDPGVRGEAQADLVAALAEAGEVDRAEQVAHDITDSGGRARAQARLVAALAEMGEVDRAERIARGITDSRAQVRALASLGTTLASAGDYERAQALTELAVAIVDDIPDDRDREYTLFGLIEALARMGQPDWVEHLATGLSVPVLRGDALIKLFEASTRAGLHDRADDLAEDMIDLGARSEHLRRLVEILAEAGQFDRAEDLTRTIADPDDRAWALTGLAARAAAVGDRDRCRALAELVVSTTGEIVDLDDRVGELVRVVEGLLGAGERDRARAALDLAVAAAGQITDADDRGTQLARLVTISARMGDHGLALELAESAIEIADELSEASDRADVLIFVVDALTSDDQLRLSRSDTVTELLSEILTTPTWKKALKPFLRHAPEALRSGIDTAFDLG